MERITDSMLKARLERLNQLIGASNEKYVKDENGKIIGGSPNHHCFEFAYGMVGVHKMGSDMNTGECTVIPLGTKRETFERLVAYISGIQLAKELYNIA